MQYNNQWQNRQWPGQNQGQGAGPGAGYGAGQGGGYNNQPPPNPNYRQQPINPQPQQDNQTNKPPIGKEIFSSLAIKLIIITLIIIVITLGIYLAFAFLSWAGLQAQDFHHYLNRLLRKQAEE